MKTLTLYLMMVVAIMLSHAGLSQNNAEPVALGLPGDNLNLYAVLDIFQKSPTLEAFERSINEKNNKINNLDLNNDKVIDYIEVKSTKTGNTNIIVLQTAINNKEYQDIAALDVHKNSAGKVIVQIVGDEVLYGKNYIVEPVGPSNISETPNPGYSGNATQDNTNVTINNYSNGIYYANDWPIVGYLYNPGFAVYISPWHWGLYPSWWDPWEPIAYYDYWGYHYQYYDLPYYRRVTYVRYPNYYHRYQTSRRSYSPTVMQYRSIGRYDNTYAGRTYSRPAAPIAELNRAAARPVPVTSGASGTTLERRSPAINEPVRVTPPVNTRVAKPSINPTRAKPVPRPSEIAKPAPTTAKPTTSTTRTTTSTTRTAMPTARTARTATKADAILTRTPPSSEKPDATLSRPAAPATRPVPPASPSQSRPAPAARPVAPRQVMPGIGSSVPQRPQQSPRLAPQQSREPSVRQ